MRSPKASQDVVKTVQLGAALAELLLSCAKVEVPAEQADLTLRCVAGNLVSVEK